ncbi:MAG: molybdopterin-dependent oxidoreductase [Ilumatobacter sp.]|nr:molybdopterin-dependent oxidoreductase [Ilumatobacter sp.]
MTDDATAAIESATIDERRAAILGVSLGITFTLCALTGLFSWGASQGAAWWPARPAGLYRVTQGVHLVSGVVSVPLLLAKLRTVAPRLVQRPLITSFAHAVERISLLPLVGGSIFMLFSGVTNVAYWYPQEFYGIDIGYFFPAAHGKMAIVVMGALVAHVCAKIVTTREALRRETVANESPAETLDRRRFLGGVAATAGLVGVTVAGATVYPLRGVGLLSARHPTSGPQGVPVNRTAAAAGVRSVATSADYRLVVEDASGELAAYSLSDLRALDQHEYELPIACVEGWSASARWRGIRLRDLLAAAGVDEAREVDVVSIQEETARGRRYGTSTVSAEVAGQHDTLLAMELNGEPLHIDHGFPVRLIAPNRPGVNQTKWLAKVVVT